MIYVWFILAGSFAGLCAGLFGVGGGLVIIPTLMFIFKNYGYSSNIVTHLAVGTSLATIMVTSISSTLSHHAHKAICWDIWRHMAGGLVLGSLLGAGIADSLDAKSLIFLIAFFSIGMGLKMLLGRKTNATQNVHLPSTALQFVMGGIIGLISALFGIGGGSMTVPFLNRYGLSIQQAIATSAACGIPIAVAGAIGFALFGQDVSDLPQGAIGFVHIPAFLCISFASFFMAKIGAKLAHRLPATTLKRIFGGLLFLVGVHMLLSHLLIDSF